MGQAASDCGPAWRRQGKEKSQTPPEVKDFQRHGIQRQEYLQRLGIQRDGRRCSAGPPRAPAAAAPVPNHPEEPPSPTSSISTALPNLAHEASKASASDVSTSASDDGESTAADDKGPEDKDEVANSKGAVHPGVRNDFRTAFLRKLSYQRVWVPQAKRPPQHQTLTIFDWDDTLLCTSFLQTTLREPMTAATEAHLRGIERVASRLLEQALGIGQAFIITNATPGWVEYSCARFVPGLLPALRRVRVISARGKYEAQFPQDVAQWKLSAFAEVQRQLDSEIITNIISIGDSEAEMDAAYAIGKGFTQALIKTIKFRELPSPEEVVKQLQLVEQRYKQVVQSATNLRIGLARK